jgi:hypothetical protein
VHFVSRRPVALGPVVVVVPDGPAKRPNGMHGSDRPIELNSCREIRIEARIHVLLT